MPVVQFQKKLGETPLEALGRFRLAFPRYEKEKLSYAGRLDPMAEGELLVLVGESNKQREKYLGLDKEYEFEVLLGCGTDTYDLLGFVETQSTARMLPSEKFSAVLHSFLGKRIQKYPPFSSKAVGGVALHKLARVGKISEIEIPSREVEVSLLDMIGERTVAAPELLTEVLARVGTVRGDFRQEEIVKKWKAALARLHGQFQIFGCRARVSSGTYIRALAHELGERLGTKALAFSIKRTKFFL